MIAFLTQNLGTIVVSLVILTAIVFIIRKMIKDKKSGGCHGGCSGCSMSETCHKH